MVRSNIQLLEMREVQSGRHGRQAIVVPGGSKETGSRKNKVNIYGRDFFSQINLFKSHQMIHSFIQPFDGILIRNQLFQAGQSVQ